MEQALQVAVAFFCLPLTALGVRSMFTPASMGEAVAIAPEGRAGLSTIRGVLGGLFLACVAMLALGLATHQATWFLAVAIVMGVVILGRLVGIVADGFDKAVVPPLVVELVIAGVLVSAYSVFGAAWT